MDYKYFIKKIETDKSFKQFVLAITNENTRINRIVKGSTASSMTTTLDYVGNIEISL